MTPNDSVQQIKEKLDIVDVIKERITLIPAGKNFKAICPFHREKTPSFMVSPDRQTWHCFGSCNEGGDIFSFIMKYEHVEFYEALQLLAQQAGVELKRMNPAMQQEFGVLYDIQLSAQEFFIQQYSQNKEAQSYITGRGIKLETQELFSIGYAPHQTDSLMVYLLNAGYDAKDIERAGLVIKTERGTYVDRFRGRLMFPLHNNFGKTVGFSGRILPEFENEKTGKYINSPETPIFNKSKVLYGLDLAKTHIREAKECVVVEGQMDVILMHQDGVSNTVGTSGTALTSLQLESIRKLAEDIIFFFDSDEAGKIATERAIDMAHELDFTVRIYHTEQEKDAAEFILKQPQKIGLQIKTQAKPALEYYLQTYIADPQGASIKKGVRIVLEKLRHITSPIEQTRWIRAIAKHTHITEQAVAEEYRLLQKTKEIKQKTPPPADQQSSQAQIVPQNTRAEKIALHILQLAQFAPEAGKEIDAYKPFFPLSYGTIMEALEHKRTDSISQECAAFIELQASVRLPETDPEKLLLEIKFLLKELKKEHLKERREEILKQIQKAEREDSLKRQVSELLKEFDEITKLIDN